MWYEISRSFSCHSVSVSVSTPHCMCRTICLHYIRHHVVSWKLGELVVHLCIRSPTYLFYVVIKVAI